MKLVVLDSGVLLAHQRALRAWPEHMARQLAQPHRPCVCRVWLGLIVLEASLSLARLAISIAHQAT